MAGGTWTDQNKVLPGVYINYASSPSTLATMGERGVVCIPKQLNWAPQEEFITIEDPKECFVKLGYDQLADEMIWLRQMLLGTNRTSGASKILVWNLKTTSGVKASGTSTTANITVNAKYTGTRGNGITVVITPDPDNTSSKTIFYVQTLVDGSVVDTQKLEASASSVTYANLKNNDWVTFESDETTSTAAEASITLTGGANGTLASDAISGFLSAAELKTWNVLAYEGSDTTTKSAIAAFVKRLANDEGKKVVACMSNYPSADFETTISVYDQNFTLNTGHEMTDAEMVCWYAGASAGANVSESLTYASHPEAVALSPVLTQTQQAAAINAGQVAFLEEFGNYKVLQDINTFRSFTATKSKAFSKNRVIRTIFGLCNDIYKVFSESYIGNTNNDEFGRDLLKAEIINLMNRYQGNGALQNVLADDVIVSKGQESDSVLIEVNCQPVDSIEKIYVNITIS